MKKYEQCINEYSRSVYTFAAASPVNGHIFLYCSDSGIAFAANVLFVGIGKFTRQYPAEYHQT